MFPTLSTKLLNISKLVHGILDMVCSTVHVECDIFASITFANGAYGQEQFYPLILLSKITRSLISSQNVMQSECHWWYMHMLALTYPTWKRMEL